MAFELVDFTAVKATPSVDAATLDIQSGTLFGTGKKFTDDHQLEWVNVYLPPPLQTIDGWVKSTDGRTVDDPAPAPLDAEMFVRQCTLVDRSLNADPAGGGSGFERCTRRQGERETDAHGADQYRPGPARRSRAR